MKIKPQPLAPDARLIRMGRGLFAATGLRRVLAPGKIAITQGDFTKAAKLEPDLRQVVYDFLAGERGTEPLPAYDHDDVSQLLFAALDPAALEDDLTQFKGHPGGDDFIAAASTAAEFLKGKMPRRFHVTWTGPRPSRPARSELLTFRRYLETVGNPLWAVRQLLAGTLSREHVEALAAVWPDVLQVVRMAVEEAKADRLEADADWQPGRRVGRQMAVLLEQDPTAPLELVKAFQDGYFIEAQQQKAAAAAREKRDQGLETPVQRVAAQ